jgi:hypothetical protein
LQDHEGHSGRIISEVHDKAKESAPKYKPNLILINVGLNDCGRNVDISDAGSRMTSMIDFLFQAIPGTTVILSTLVPNDDGPTDACIQNVNRQYRNLAQNYARQRFALADMYAFLTKDDIDNGHPNNSGYLKMASVWWSAIQGIETNIQPPDGALNDSLDIAVTNCAKSAAPGRGPVQIQGGSGHDDGEYVHQAACATPIWTTPVAPRPTANSGQTPPSFESEIYFAQLVNIGGVPRGDELDDLIHAYVDQVSFTWKYKYALNSGAALGAANKFGSWVTFNPGNCQYNELIAWADLNNDGLDDFYCIGISGQVSVSLNLGGNPPTWDGLHPIIGSQVPGSMLNVRIAEYVFAYFLSAYLLQVGGVSF